MHKIFSFSLLLLFLFAQSCNNKQSSKNKDNNTLPENPKTTALIKLEQPQNGGTFTTADNVTIQYKTLSDTIVIDSTVLNVNGKRITAFNGLSHQLPLKQSVMGMQRVSLNAYSQGKQIGTLSFVMTVKPQHPPKTYSYQVVNEYPHDPLAYTQGLYYHNGFLYEGLGEKGHSALRKVELKTGKVLQNVNIDASFFGEGICLLNNRIYQLTWQNHVGLIYNADTFEKIGEFSYATEGWGLTTDGTHLIMSDGTQNLYFIDPATMTIVRQIETYSDFGAIKWLNELEYINGEIWANIYEDDKIVRIDPATGEVKGIINLKDILKSADRKQNTDVLNGIAYDPATKRIFVTGKRWVKLFEITLIETSK